MSKIIVLPRFQLDCIRVARRLYFCVSENINIRSTSKDHFFSTDNEMIYKSEYSDFGPLNIAWVCRYIKKLEKKLKLKILAHKNIIHVTSSNNPRKAANAACLAAMYRLLVLELDPTRAFAPFARYGDNTFKPFTVGSKMYKLRIMDFLNGFHK